MISERLTGRTRNVTLCGTIARERNVYVSMTNSIDVALVHHTQIIENDIQEDEEDSPAFLLKYRGGSINLSCAEIESEMMKIQLIVHEIG